MSSEYKGRRFTAKEIMQLERLAMIGMQVKRMAYVLDIELRTLNAMIEHDKNAQKALELGRSKCDEAILNTAFELAVSGKNVAMTMFYLKCRMGWREDGMAFDAINNPPPPVDQSNAAKLSELARKAA